jgi:ABC-2 type transport system permease protein
VTALAPEAPAPAAKTSASRTTEMVGLRPGWMTIAGKELTDHLVSVRLYVLLIVLGISALIPLYFGAERIRSLAEDVSGAEAIFLALFLVGPEGNFGPIAFTVQGFVAIAAPLLGVAFAFDAVNGERHQGTLPRLLSQPIHRDDVINGKFVAGLIAITVALVAILALISGFGMLRLGIVPELEEVVRLVAWLGVTVLYVALWLAFGLLLSVVIRRAATSALVGFGVWLFVAIPFIGPLLAQLAGSFVASRDTPDSYYGTIQLFERLLPGKLYSEASSALLNPSLTSVSDTCRQGYCLQQLEQLPTLLPFDQSFLLILPHVIVLLALTIGCFALAYVQFMRQEVRA